MTTACIRFFRPAWAVLVLGSALVAGPALAAGDKTAAAEARAAYDQQRAMCTSGQSNQDRATCLKEAGAAFAEGKQGRLEDHADKVARNASKRCDPLPEADRQACMARMQGKGTTSGSVAGGGISRELVTRETGPAVPAAGAASAVPAMPAR